MTLIGNKKVFILFLRHLQYIEKSLYRYNLWIVVGKNSIFNNNHGTFRHLRYEYPYLRFCLVCKLVFSAAWGHNDHDFLPNGKVTKST